MQSDLESVIGNGARKLAQDLLGQKNLGVSVAYGCVSCVNDDGTIDVEVEDDEFASLPATTACMGAKPGDRCLVQTYAHQSTVTGILSLGDFPARSLDIDLIYPVGAIVQFWDARDPNELWPGTTWAEVTGVFLYARSTGRTVGNTGGEETHVLSTSEMPAHTHGASPAPPAAIAIWWDSTWTARWAPRAARPILRAYLVPAEPLRAAAPACIRTESR